VLTIDSREPSKVRRKIANVISKVDGWTIEVETLEVGDYDIDHEIIVERKTMGDYIGSVRDGRIFTQCYDMDAYDASYVVITGSYEDVKYCDYLKSFSVNQWIGSRCSILAKTKAKILQVDNLTQFANTLVSLQEKHSNLDKTLLVERHSKTMNRVDPNLAMYLVVPGIGMSTAMKLTKEYPRFLDFVEAQKDGRVTTRIQTKSKKFLNSIRKMEQ